MKSLLLILIVSFSVSCNACESWWDFDRAMGSLKWKHKCSPGVVHRIPLGLEYHVKNIMKLSDGRTQYNEIVLGEDVEFVSKWFVPVEKYKGFILISESAGLINFSLYKFNYITGIYENGSYGESKLKVKI